MAALTSLPPLKVPASPSLSVSAGVTALRVTTLGFAMFSARAAVFSTFSARAAVFSTLSATVDVFPALCPTVALFSPFSVTVVDIAVPLSADAVPIPIDVIAMAVGITGIVAPTPA